MKKFKRITGFCLLFITCLCLISCGDKTKVDTLKCNRQLTNADGLLTSMATDVNFEDDVLTTITLKWSVKYDKNTYTDQEVQTLASDTVGSYNKTYGDSKNIKISSAKTGDNEYTVYLVVDYDKLTPEEKNKYSFNFESDKDNTKTELESSGYACK